jgi:hypothetical protein
LDAGRRVECIKRNCEIDFDRRYEHENSLCQNVLQYFSREQKTGRKEINSDFLVRFLEKTDVLEKVVTGGETQVFQYDPETNAKVVSSGEVQILSRLKSELRTMPILF